LFDIGAGKAMSPSARLGERTYPFLRTANVFWGRLDLTTLDTMNFSENEIEKKSLRKGDLLVCEGGDIGRSAIWSGEIEKCGFQNHIHRLRPKSNGTIPAFVMYYLQAGFTQLGIYEGAGNKTTIPNLSRGRLAALLVPTPQTTEQEKIASILLKIQRAIEVEEKLVATTRELKQSAMRQLFTHGLRGEPQKETEIGPVPQSWEILPLEAVCTFASGGTPSKANPEFWSGRIPWASPKDLKRPRLADVQDHISQAGLEAGSTLVPPGSLFVVIRGMILMRDVPVALTEVAMAFNQDMKAILPGKRVAGEFLLYAFECFKGMLFQKIGRSAHGTRTLFSSEIARFLVPIPPLSMQQEITTILQTIDRKISIHERKRTTLQDLFKTMLHKLMTAEIRVANLDIDTSEVIT
jgi:type I restriction enzyme S subunit